MRYASRREPERVRPTLLIVSQVYPPDPTAVGQHIADVAESMAARGWKVVVYSSARGYDDPSVRYVAREDRSGVAVRRLPLSSFGKSSIAVRLLAGLMFCLQASVRGSFHRRVGAILVSTSPPFCNVFGAALSWWHRAPLTWWVMDLNPDQMIQLGRITRTSISARFFDWMNRVTLRRARAVVVLDEHMRRLVAAKARPAGTIRVLPPWSHDLDCAQIIAPDVNPFRIRHGLQGKFVVMYSGNHGLTNPMETLLEAASRLSDDPRIVFMFVGGGARKYVVDDYIRLRKPGNVVSLPYQPLADIRYSLSAADIHVVSVAPEAVGVSHSCKIYGAMALGKPVLALAPVKSHIGDIVATYRCGWLCEHGDVESLVTRLHAISVLPQTSLEELGRAGRAATQGPLRPQTLLAEFCDMLVERRPD